MDRLDALFTPLTLRRTTVPNRLVRTAHGVRAPWVDESDQLLAYHEARAAGGTGLSILGAAAVDPGLPSGIPVGHDRVIGGYRRLSAAMHAQRSTVMQQIFHPGSAAPGRSGSAPWSASARPSPLSDDVPVAMTRGMIADVVADFAAAARRVEEGGLDGVEVHAGSGYLIEQFLSPLTNLRQDEYGGDLEQRMRFLREVLAAVRSAVSADFPVGLRLVVDEYAPGGITPETSAQIALGVEHEIDFLDLHHGSSYRYHKLLAPGDAEPLGYELPGSGAVSSVVSVPTIVAGRVMNLDDAAQIVGDGVADMVSMVRSTIADPDLVRKVRAGQESRVRPCISTNEGCLGGILTTGFRCVMNPDAGHEDARRTATAVTSPRRRAIVVGGGPAGLEAARGLAEGGHNVTLVEGRRDLGGQMRVAASAPHRSDLGAGIAWWSDELERLAVRVLTGRFADPDLVVDLAPDVLVIATGSVPDPDGGTVAHPGVPVTRGRGSRIGSTWDLFGFGGSLPLGRAAVVHDDTGTFEAVSAAEELLQRGQRVTFVTRHDSLGARVPGALATVQPARERLLAHAGFRLEPGSHLTAVTAGSVTVSRLQGVHSFDVDADTVVDVGFNPPERGLLEALQDEGYAGVVHVVGEASGVRGLQRSIADAAALTRDIGVSR